MVWIGLTRFFDALIESWPKITPYPNGTVPFLTRSLAINCQATIITSLRESSRRVAHSPFLRFAVSPTRDCAAAEFFGVSDLTAKGRRSATTAPAHPRFDLRRCAGVGQKAAALSS